MLKDIRIKFLAISHFLSIFVSNFVLPNLNNVLEHELKLNNSIICYVL